MSPSDTRGKDRNAGSGRISLDPSPRWSAASRALLADDGALWIRSSVDAERGYVWTVFPVDGSSPRRTRVPVGFDLKSIRGNRMFGVAKTENDADVVRVYQWEWNRSS